MAKKGGVVYRGENLDYRATMEPLWFAIFCLVCIIGLLVIGIILLSLKLLA